jgi:manganese-dependent ADP-ribose/CDP-alcohol diphosphatase
MKHLIRLAAAIVSLGNGHADESTKPRPPVTFGLITDVQYADAEPQGERHYKASPAKLEQAVAALNQAHVAFTLNLGDTIDHDFKSFATITAITAKFSAPLHSLLGNHDYSVPDADKPHLTQTLGMPGDYYAFRGNGIRVIMLDTNGLSLIKYPAGSPQTAAANEAYQKLKAAGAPNAQKWNGGVDDTQLAWLDLELTASDAVKEPVIVCGHHPLLPAGPHLTWNSGVVTAMLLRHHCVKAWFNGHNHDGAFAEQDGLPFITFLAMLHKPDTTAYAIIRMFPDHMEITGFGREPSRNLAFRQ